MILLKSTTTNYYRPNCTELACMPLLPIRFQGGQERCKAAAFPRERHAEVRTPDVCTEKRSREGVEVRSQEPSGGNRQGWGTPEGRCTRVLEGVGRTDAQRA